MTNDGTNFVLLIPRHCSKHQSALAGKNNVESHIEIELLKKRQWKILIVANVESMNSVSTNSSKRPWLASPGAFTHTPAVESNFSSVLGTPVPVYLCHFVSGHISWMDNRFMCGLALGSLSFCSWMDLENMSGNLPLLEYLFWEVWFGNMDLMLILICRIKKDSGTFLF